jgi:hypothetical protein
MCNSVMDWEGDMLERMWKTKEIGIYTGPCEGRMWMNVALVYVE